MPAVKPAATDTNFKAQPFKEAVDFFRAKVNVPTRRWDEIWQGAHARAFMIAGAMKADIVSDFRLAVDKAVAGGTFKDFQKDFDAIVARHGWDYNGSRGWRTRVIYQTNLTSANQAGRYRQMMDPAVLAYRPYWQYVHGDSVHPRPEHLAWDGLVLVAEDPFWSTHYPQNGWGCHCRVKALSRRDLAKLGKSGPDQAPPVVLENGTPKGIDKGFAFNMGEAAFGRPIAKAKIDAAQGGKWKDDPQAKGPADYGRTGPVPLDHPKAPLAAEPVGRPAYDALFRKTFGGDTATLVDAAGDGLVLDANLIDHIADRPDGRGRYLPLVRELVEDPHEIWASFAVNELTGQYGIRRRYVKGLDLGKGVAVALVADAMDGVWTGLTLFRGREAAAEKLRRGVLVYGRPRK